MEYRHSSTVTWDDVKIRYCETHPGKEIIGFCEKCNAFFCKKCVMGHIWHKMIKLEDFCEEKKKSVLDKISIDDLIVQLEGRRDEATKTREKLDKDYNDIEKRVIIKEDKEDIYEHELGRLETISRYLVGLEEEASTVVLKNACEEAIELFDLEEEIRNELVRCSEGTRRVQELKRELDRLNEEITTLDYLKGDDGGYEFDNNDKWTAFLLLNEKTPLFKTSYCINTTVDNFRAFPFVEKVFDIDGVLKQRLVEIGQEVKMSEPIKLDKRLSTGNWISASLSHQGILAIYTHNPFTIQFNDLNTSRQVRIRVEKDSLVGFYDNNAILLTQGEYLREATVERAFNYPSVTSFGIIGGAMNVCPWTDVSLLHERRVLYYPTTDNRLFSFNVDTRESVEINLGYRVSSIASFTGIDCGLKIVFQASDNRTYALNMNDTVTMLKNKEGGNLTAIFPATSDPTDINSAVFKYGRGIMKYSNKIDTSKQIRFDGNYSIVRVYKDIFLAYNKGTESWILIRLITEPRPILPRHLLQGLGRPFPGNPRHLGWML